MANTYTGPHGELDFESDFVKLLTQVGWDSNVIRNPSHTDLENNFRKILNENNVDKLGTGTPITDNEFKQIMDKINSDCTTPIAANVFINGKQVVIKSEINRPNYRIGDDIYLMMFDPVEVAGGKSRYQIAEQIYFKTGDKYNDRRGDVMLLINGLPLIHIELKASGHELEEGMHQIQKYMNEGVYKGLFSLIQVFFVMTPDDCIYFANSYPKLDPTFMFHWGSVADNKPVHNWRDLIIGKDHILSIPEAHQLIGYYTCASIEKDSNGCIENINSNGTLMVARSYQVHAIRSIISQVKNHVWGTHTPHGGYVWGTTGCGKTLTSYKSGQLIIDKNLADKVVFVVDRIELSDQSFKEYNAFARDGEPIKLARNTHNLRNLLLNDNDKLIITSIQKLSRINEDMNGCDKTDIDKINEKRIVYIVDEAHRSQFGEMHISIENTFPNAMFIGFTGTPIFTENDKAGGMTSESVFGKCLAVYSIASGIRDKNVLGFNPIMVRTFEDKDLKDAIARDKLKIGHGETIPKEKRSDYNRIFNSSMLDIERAMPASQYNCEEHRKAVVENIIDNWDILSNNGGRIKFHALFATSSIPEAVEYYRLFKEQKDTTGLKVTALFDPNVNANTQAIIDKEQAIIEIVDDYNEMFNTGPVINRNADTKLTSFKTDITNRLAHKGPYKHITDDDMIDIVIVVDQLLTGFDSKYINTLYLDKVLETDGLIQAISRTNRVIDFEEKPWGVFKYYRMPYTMEQNIKDALRLYCEGGENSGAIADDVSINIKIANDRFDEIKYIFESEDIDDFTELPESETSRKAFKLLFRELVQKIHEISLQGMNWKSDSDKYVLQLHVCEKWIDNDTRLYDILCERYEDLPSVTRELNDYCYMHLKSHVSEIEGEKINADYLEEHFKQKVIPCLLNNSPDDEKDSIIKKFESLLAQLSAEQQKYANIIIDDIKTGELVVSDKTLKELIAEYQLNAENKKITDFADEYGLDENIIHEIYHIDGNHDMEISKLLDNCNKTIVETKFNCKWLIARAKLNKTIKDFIE